LRLEEEEKSCSDDKAVGSYFFIPADLENLMLDACIMSFENLIRGLVFQSCGPLYLPVGMLTKGALSEMWFTSVRLSSLTILAAKARH
jgi:hypothetical protein